MSPQQWERVKELFEEALETGLRNHAQSIHDLANGDADVEAEVLRLLKANDRPDALLDGLRPPPDMASSAAQLRVFFGGEVLVDRYRIVRFLAQGGMGEVYEAEDLEAGERIAIKTLRAELVAHGRILSLRREVRAARQIAHLNVCRVFELVETTTATGAPLTFLTMELIAGETLLERIRRGGPLSEREAFPLIRSIAAGLAAAHRAGIVHGDLKCANVMIAPRPEGPPRVVVMDFGLSLSTAAALAISSTRSRETSYGGGTPAYMAPEQIEGKKAGPAADIYALGVILHEMLTGELPFAEETALSMAVRKTRGRPQTPAILAPALRATWAATILRCLDKNPGKRPDGAEQVVASLNARHRGVMWLRWLQRPRYKWARAAGIAAMAMAMLFGMWRLLPVNPDQRSAEEWRQAVWALHAGEPALAARRLEAALSARQLPVEARAHLAQAWLELGFPDRATSELLRAQWEPIHTASGAALLAAVAAQRDGHNDEALRLLDQRVQEFSGPNADPQLRVIALADAAALAGKLHTPDEQQRWQRVVDADPQNPVAHLEVAELYARAGRMLEAQTAFLRAELFWQARGDAELLRQVSARRGLANLASGQIETARRDLPSLRNLLHLPAGAAFAPCERSVELMAGTDDNFSLPYEPSSPPPALWKQLSVRAFDEDATDLNLFATFPLPRERVCSGLVEMRIRADPNDPGRADDSLTLSASEGPQPVPMRQYPLWNGSTARTSVFVSNIDGDFLRQLQSLPGNMLLVNLQDDTAVDYIRITLVY